MNAINESISPGPVLPHPFAPPLLPLPLPGGPPPNGLPPLPRPPPLPTADMDAYVNKQIFDTFEIVVNSVVINALSIAGSAGNVMCIYILCLHGFSSSTNVILVSLAVADLLILVTMPLRKISLLIEPFDRALAITVESHVVGYHFLTLNRVWSLTSNAHVTLIAVERFLAVYFPFKVSQWTTVPRMTVIVIVLHVVFYLLLIPLFSMFKLVWVFDPNLNETIAIPGLTDFFLEREEEFKFYNSYIINLLLSTAFLVVTLFCCVGICIKLIILSRKRRIMMGSSALKTLASTTVSRNTMQTIDESESNFDLKTDSESNAVIKGSENSVFTSSVDMDKKGDETSSSKNPKSTLQTKKSNTQRIDKKVVKLLLIVCVVYLILIFPSFLLFVFQEIYQELREPYWRRVNFLATSISMLLIALNSSLNFIVYVINSQKFYETFKRLISRNKAKKGTNVK